MAPLAEMLRTKLFCELANAGSIGLLPLNAPRLFTYVGTIDVIRRIECRRHLASGVSYRGRQQLVFFFRLPAESKYSCTTKETLRSSTLPRACRDQDVGA